jgi:hypothetical protein
MGTKELIRIVNTAKRLNYPDNAALYLLEVWRANHRDDPVGEAKKQNKRDAVHALKWALPAAALVASTVIWKAPGIVMELMPIGVVFFLLVAAMVLFMDIKSSPFGYQLEELFKEIGLRAKDIPTIGYAALKCVYEGALTDRALAVIRFQTGRQGVPHEHWETTERSLQGSVKGLLYHLVQLGICSTDVKPWYERAKMKLAA